MSELNPEQQKAVSHKDGPLLILAGAGAGKTRVIVERIVALIKSGVAPENILAVTFTNKAAKEVQERIARALNSEWALSPLGTHAPKPFAATFHGLSLHIIKTFHTQAGLPKRFSIFDRSDSLRAVKKAIESAGFDPKELEPSRVLAVMGRHKGFARGSEEFRSEGASSYIDEAIAEVWEKYEAILKKENALDFDDILLTAYRLLTKHSDIREYFQKAWTHIHVDEYQDTNYVQYEIVRTLAEKQKNICVVGDADQCLVKGTRVTMANGSQKPIEKVKEGDVVLSNYGSGDMRPATVTKTRTRVHRKHLIRIATESGKTLVSTPQHIHFADYRLGIAPQYHFTYLMYKKGVGWRLGTSQVYTKSAKARVGFKQRCVHEHADAAWIVGVFNTPQEARVHEYSLSLRYGIPTLPFVARKGISTNGYVHDQEVLDALFKSFDTERGALRLMRDKNIYREYPHHRAQSETGVRRSVTVTLCGDRRGARPMHRIAMVGRDSAGKNALKVAGFSIRSAKKGSASWRMETCNKDYAEVLALVKKIQETLPETEVVQNARLGKKEDLTRTSNSLRFMPAESLVPGMALFSENGAYDVVKSVETIDSKESPVYDIDVESTHNFIANGITTHNCIYSWRGASIEHILNFENDFPGTTTVLLSRNYRSTKNILQVANDAIAKNVRRKDKVLITENDDGEAIKIAGLVSEEEEARFVTAECKNLIDSGFVAEDIAVLYRANFQSRALEEAFLKSGVPYQVLGTRFFERKEIKDVLSYLRLAENPESSTDLARVINTPARGIGKVTVAKVLSGQDHALSPAIRAKVHAFRVLIQKLGERIKTEKPSEVIKKLLDDSGMKAHYEQGKGENEERLENLKELVSVASKYDALPQGEGIQKLLEESALQSDQDELPVKKEDRPGVKLMTVHASKGLEFPVVFIVGLEEGLFPHERDGSDVDTEEERRLFYVAITRARKIAYLSYALSRRIFGTRSIQTPSEFIMEIDPALTQTVAFPLWQDQREPDAYDNDGIIIE
ncbi:hypothetical protein COU15_02850 [Candidatus Kaiserbacteria bacterium CG10_big_fil_rev_8_21_14_0_10_45_20]|uniref:DNA 3'-5' helicase n=1 Tax=Candidatus Kaiserbacteria bacterium CG10_big_fil_rev_8_21_14_0_10_45_20 TaxID=1974607 RepID=A0A2H0UFB1_9BACT|nr:MAG: hypothetical protein COU15_02850 [Candidatus Kaiserbacteria bacterium CG10_big_fil_rev_8_21_14_0_10_45_20]